MKRILLALVCIGLLAPRGAMAEFRQIDLSIFGMD